MPQSAVKPSQKLLNLIKNNDTAFWHPELAFYNPKVQEERPSPLGTHDIAVMSKMRFSLNSLWGTILLKLGPGERHLLFTGCTRGDGTSFISFHMAMYLAAEHKLKVLYVDTDVDRRGTDTLYCAKGFPGLTNYFLEGGDLSDLVLQSNVEGFSVLPSGSDVAKISSSNVITRQDLIERLFAYGNEHFDIVIHDCQPITLSPLTTCFSKFASHIFMVCRYATTRREICMLAIDKFRESGYDVAGMLINDRQYPVPKVVYNILK